MKRNSNTAILLTAPGCVHCASMKKILEKLLDEGTLDKLEIIDVTVRPDVAAHYGVKSVPWLRLGRYPFVGGFTEKEIREWMQGFDTQMGIAQYIGHMLAGGGLGQIIEMVRDESIHLSDVLPLVVDPEQEMKVKLGVSAVFEEFEGNPVLRNLIDELAKLVSNSNARVRADAAHFLSLTHDDAALPYLQTLSIDEDREVREIAMDALKEIELSQ